MDRSRTGPLCRAATPITGPVLIYQGRGANWARHEGAGSQRLERAVLGTGARTVAGRNFLERFASLGNYWSRLREFLPRRPPRRLTGWCAGGYRPCCAARRPACRRAFEHRPFALAKCALNPGGRHPRSPGQSAWKHRPLVEGTPGLSCRIPNSPAGLVLHLGEFRTHLAGTATPFRHVTIARAW